ncbi:hypothetical protein W97_03863 [Coniosporium apollinis CBS 100218]|uniref:3-hydroxyacyl-CoA dehydrogenase type-2 n=1 Tax=Coniosporium apollinis (strain CBS 100218) TaxID=1168221 RepID=R7YRW1_CONA1|nr:uncharacterized protein W97_03863 [Coniosporium apollinis CBS 100218]EON64630.1 hypothetical protein W97_03863 [Coniosporium apollinis CBS 100218]
MAEPVTPPQLDLRSKTVVVTGGANGIGAQTVREYYARGANVVVADLPSSRTAAETLIFSFAEPARALFIPTNIVVWDDMKSLFKATVENFGPVHIVVANAGMMESQGFYDMELDEHGELKEPIESYRVIDVNLKGTMNTLRLAMHHMSTNPEDSIGQSRGSVVLVASTSGYFGGSGVVSYVASKHGVIGLLRSSQIAAARYNVRVNGVAPFFTPTHITSSYSERWRASGLPANTVEDVALAILQTSLDPLMRGRCCLAAGKRTNEIEAARTALLPMWVGEEMANILAEGGRFFDKIGGYPLPKIRPS